jgi:hypothetical protein
MHQRYDGGEASNSPRAAAFADRAYLIRIACSAFAGFRFPSDVIVLAVRW